MNHSLATLGDSSGRTALVQNLKDDNSPVRTCAATFAGGARITDAADVLEIMLDDPHPDAAIRAAQSLLVRAAAPVADQREDISHLLYPATETSPRDTERSIVALSNGDLLMLIRTQPGYIGKCYSTDRGNTWTHMTSPGLKGPESPAGLRRIPSTGDLLLIWNNTCTESAGHGARRTPLTAAISNDEGESWRVVSNLESSPERTFSYTILTFGRDRAVMSYWESGPDQGQLSCRFRSLPVTWFYNRLSQ